MPKRTLREYLVRALFLTRFGPIETVVCISAIIHGLWLMFPNWSTATGDSVGPLGAVIEVTTGTLLLLISVAHMTSMYCGLDSMRRNTAFIKFMLWLFVAWIALVSTAATSIVWVAYLTIALIEGLVYLNISLGGENL